MLPAGQLAEMLIAVHPRLGNQLVDQRGLTMVNMGNDRNIT
jgi:hypothetical protein